MSADWYAKQADRCRRSRRLHAASSFWAFAATASAWAGAVFLSAGWGPLGPVLLVILGCGFLLTSIVLAIAGAVVEHRIKRGRP